MNTSRCTNNNMCATGLKLFDIVFYNSASNTSLYFYTHILTNWVNDICNLHRKFACWRNNKGLTVIWDTTLWVSVDTLENTNSERASFTSTRLGLSNGVLALDDWQDTFLLDGWWVFETVTIYATKHTLLQPHVVKLTNFQFPVRFENLLNSFLTFLISIFILIRRELSFFYSLFYHVCV